MEVNYKTEENFKDVQTYDLHQGGFVITAVVAAGLHKSNNAFYSLM